MMEVIGVRGVHSQQVSSSEDDIGSKKFLSQHQTLHEAWVECVGRTWDPMGG